jgi:hypothetical protein
VVNLVLVSILGACRETGSFFVVKNAKKSCRRCLLYMFFITFVENFVKRNENEIILTTSAGVAADE